MDCGGVMRHRVYKRVPVVDRQKKTLLGYQLDGQGRPVVVPVLIRTPLYHEQEVQLVDSFARLFRCVECCKRPLDAEKVTRQIKLAWIEEMTAAQRSLTDKKDVLKQHADLQVTGVLEHGR